uniref:Uncharacterized protein n=1 Tax=Octopus bimaculoides TaxID=37653 RepID=A0A0L8FTH9_OCTBM
MSGPPICLMVDPNTKPIAHHIPIPVQVRWQEEVKAGFDHNVQLGVTDLVTIGTPVTWCHRVVPLNRHTVHETHHTQSPFHQVCFVPPNTRKTSFDAWNGYYSIALNEREQKTLWHNFSIVHVPGARHATADTVSRYHVG